MFCTKSPTPATHVKPKERAVETIFIHNLANSDVMDTYLSYVVPQDTTQHSHSRFQTKRMINHCANAQTRRNYASYGLQYHAKTYRTIVPYHHQAVATSTLKKLRYILYKSNITSILQIIDLHHTFYSYKCMCAYWFAQMVAPCRMVG